MGLHLRKCLHVECEQTLFGDGYTVKLVHCTLAVPELRTPSPLSVKCLSYLCSFQKNLPSNRLVPLPSPRMVKSWMWLTSCPCTIPGFVHELSACDKFVSANSLSNGPDNVTRPRNRTVISLAVNTYNVTQEVDFFLITRSFTANLFRPI